MKLLTIIPTVLCCILCMSVTIHAQVGINTMSPTATLHIQDVTTPSTGGGTTSLVDLNFDGYTVSQDFVPDTSCITTDGWVASSSAPSGYQCSGCVGSYLYIESDDTDCDQDATVIIDFTPTDTSVTLSFDYLFREFSSGADSLRAYLYDGTAQVGADIIFIDNASNTTTDSSYSGSLSVTAGVAYSFRIEYIGSFGYGATVDNVLIEEETSGAPGYYAFRLEDGQEQNGYVLTSDANGNATWEASSGGGGGGTDDQTIDVFSLSGNTLSLSLENDGVATETVNLSSIAGTDDQTIDVFNISGTILSISLENDGVATETVDLSGLGGGGGSYTFENGLTESTAVVALGGTLNKDTTIDLEDYDLTLESSTSAIFPGEFIWQGTNRRMMSTNFDDDYVLFGQGSTIVDGDNGLTYTDSGGETYTRNFLLGYYNGEFGGSTISTGSIEYIVDGLDELLLEASSFNPLSDNDTRLGGSSKRWSAVWASNGTIQTSDVRKKKDIKALHYGLEEIMKLNPIEYKWKSQTIGNKSVPERDQQKLIGFSAQELLTVIPEVVETHSWYPTDEKGNFERRQNENLGVRYSEIIPVVVRAMQQQQQQIANQNKLIAELQKNQQRLLGLMARKN